MKTEGDSFYVVFDSAGTALECAVALLGRAHAHNAGHPDTPIALGIGLHAGEAIAYDKQFVGSAVNIAARLAAKAGPGELLVSDTLRGLVRTGHTLTMDDRGPLRLKGVSERVRAWCVRWGDPGAGPAAAPAVAATRARTLPLPAASPRAAPPSGVLVCPIVVGRDAELARLEGHLELAATGQACMALVSGEAGVGKSAFTSAVVQRAIERGYAVLPGVTLESDGRLPYAPFIASIRAGFRQQDRSEFARVLVRIAPDLVALFPEAAGAKVRADPGSMIEQHRLAVAFQWLFAELAREAPLLVVLEDLHWADEASLALLRHLARELGTTRALVLGTYRSDELHRRHPLSRALATLRRDRSVHELDLRRLTSEEVARVIHATLATADPRVSVGPEFRDAIFARTEGNPFFIEELLRSLVESGGLSYGHEGGWERRPLAELKIPGSVREALLARFDRLSAPAQATLATAAAIGARFAFDVLRSTRDLDEVELAAHLGEAIEQQLVVELADAAAPTYEFRHALTREAVYEGLLLPERRRLHLRVAAALAADPQTPPALLAEHWRAGGDGRRAAEAFEAAGQGALAVHAPVEAVAQFEAAIAAGGAPSVELYLGLASAYLAMDYAKARLAAERALALLGDADPGRRVELMRISGRARWAMGDADANYELARAAVALVEHAREERAKAMAYDWYASAELTRGNLAQAAEWAERALAAARSAGDPASEASALTTLAATLAPHRGAQALALLDDAAAVARRAGSATTLARVHMYGIATSHVVEPARRRFVRIERAAEFAQRYAYGRSDVAAYRAFHRCVGLDWPADGSFGVAGESATNLFVGWARLLEHLVRAAREGPSSALLDDAATLARMAQKHNEPQWSVPFTGFYALLLAWAGRAEELASSLGEIRRAAGAVSYGLLALSHLPRGLNAPAALLAMTGDRATLLGMAEALVDVEGYEGEREALLSFLAWLEGDAPSAAQRFALAATAFERRGFPFSTAVDLWALARIRPLGLEWQDALREVDAGLGQAGATWLRSQLAGRTAGLLPAP